MTTFTNIFAGPVPVAVGGYRAVAGEGGAVHEVAGLVPAPALATQESAGGVSLTTGTGAYVHLIGENFYKYYEHFLATIKDGSALSICPSC